MTNRGFTSASARCSDLRRSGAICAAFVIAALSAMRAEAAVTADGLPEWLAPAAERSLGAVWDHLPPDETDDTKRELIGLVASRLLDGYRVEDIAFEDGGPRVRLAPSGETPEWTVTVTPPALQPPVLGWFERDADGIGNETAELLRGVPVRAVLWGDAELKIRVEEICASRLPGWSISLMLHAERAGDGEAELEITFMPSPPLSLAISPRINSASIPVMLHSRLKDDLLKGYAPVIGVPSPWLDRHADDLETLTREILADAYVIDKGKTDSEIEVETGSLSHVDISVESRRYAAWVWMAVYAGAEERYPEAGVHFGRRFGVLSGLDGEIYGEAILSLEDWSLEGRFGIGLLPHRSLWLGAEWSTDERLWWGRARYEFRGKSRPYVWARISERGDANAAVGFRVTDFLSIEIHYDDRYDDKWNVRAIVNL